MTRPAHTRWLIVVALAAFVPLYWYMVVVAGLLPYGAMLLFALHNLADGMVLLWSGLHLAAYGALLYWFAGVIARRLHQLEARQRQLATGLLLLILAGVALLPIFGASHGRVEWMNAYELYASGKVR